MWGERYGNGVVEGTSAPFTSEHKRGPNVSGRWDWMITSMPDPRTTASQVRVVGVGGEVSVDVMEGLYLSLHLVTRTGTESAPSSRRGEGQHAIHQ